MNQQAAKIEVSFILEQLTRLQGRLELVVPDKDEEFEPNENIEYSAEEAMDDAIHSLTTAVGHLQNVFDAF